MTNMSDVVNNTPEGKKAVEKAVKQSIADQEAMSDTHSLITQAKKDLLAELLNLYGEPRCENLHHPKKWQHEVMKDCPVVAAIKEIEEGL